MNPVRLIRLLACVAVGSHAALVQIDNAQITASASSAIPDAWAAPLAASAAIDGDQSNFFTTNVSSGPTGVEHLDLTFANVQRNIQLVRLFPRPGGLAYPKTIRLKYDRYGNGNWQDILPWAAQNTVAPTGGGQDIGFWEIPIDAKAIRIEATDLRTDGTTYFFQLAEVQVFQETQLSNSGDNRRVVPASAFGDGAAPGFDPSALINDNLSDFYSSSYSTVNQSRYLGLDFGTPMVGLSKLEFYPRLGGYGFPESFKIQYDLTGSGNWADIPGQTYVGQAPPANGTPFIADFQDSPISTQKIRLVSLKNRVDDYGSYYLQMAEVRAYVENGIQRRQVRSSIPMYPFVTEAAVPGTSPYYLEDLNTSTYFTTLSGTGGHCIYLSANSGIQASQIGYGSTTNPVSLVSLSGVDLWALPGALNFPRSIAVYGWVGNFAMSPTTLITQKLLGTFDFSNPTTMGPNRIRFPADNYLGLTICSDNQSSNPMQITEAKLVPGIGAGWSVPWILSNATSTDDAALWSSRYIAQADNNGVYSSQQLPTATTEAGIDVSYPDPILADGVNVSPRAGWLGFPKDFQILTSMDGATWNVEQSFTNYAPNSSSTLFFGFPAKMIRFIRFRATNHPLTGGAYFFQLKSFEARQTTLTKGVPVPDPTCPSGGQGLVDNSDATLVRWNGLTTGIYALPSSTNVQYIRVGFRGGSASTQNKVEFSNDKMTWTAIDAPSLSFASTLPTAKYFPLNQTMRYIRVTTYGTCPVALNSCPGDNFVSEISTLY